MAKLNAERKQLIQNLTHKEMELALLKLAEKKGLYNFLLVNFIDKEAGEEELLEEAKLDIEELRKKIFKGKSQQHRLAKLFNEYSKIIKDFALLCKKKNLEADLVLFALEKHFMEHTKLLGSRNSTFDSKMAIMLKRLVTVVTKKLHEDYKIEYEEQINGYLTILHHKSNHLMSVEKLPERI